MRRLLFALLFALLPSLAFGQGLVAPVAPQQFLDDNGDPCSGCFLAVYLAGTTTPTNIYSDSALLVPLTNPYELNAAGRLTYYLTRDLSYKFVLLSPSGVIISTADNVALPEVTTIPTVDAVPTGTINAFGHTAAPTGYLLCDGSAVSRTTYAALYSVIGTTYGVGDGSTTFNLPDLPAPVQAAGIWTTPTFSAGDFTATGGGTVTVAAGDIGAFQYQQIGNALTVSAVINTITVAGTVSAINIAIPGGFTAAKSTWTTGVVFDNSATVSELAVVKSLSGTTIIVTLADGTNFAASTDGTYIRFQITMETTTTAALGAAIIKQ